MRKTNAALYFHYPCFDGLISAALAQNALEHDWKFEDFVPISYDKKPQWLSTNLPEYSAVVDFLYHPSAAFWSDHHSTTFVNAQDKSDFERLPDDQKLFYDESAQACAGVLRRYLALSEYPRFDEMVLWANIIDSADYHNVDEAIFGEVPATKINLTLSLPRDNEYGKFLLSKLHDLWLPEIAALPQVKQKTEIVERSINAGLKQIGKSIRLTDAGIAIFEATQTQDETISRYGAYRFMPAARYSIGLVRSEKETKITAMRNPWIEFESADLGRIFQNYGGGGHQRVASLLVKDDQNAQDLVSKIAGHIT